MGSFDDNFRAFLETLRQAIPMPRPGENPQALQNEPGQGSPFTTRTLALTAAALAVTPEKLEFPLYFGVTLDACPGGTDYVKLAVQSQNGTQDFVTLFKRDTVRFPRGTQVLYIIGIGADGDYTLCFQRDRFAHIHRVTPP